MSSELQGSREEGSTCSGMSRASSTVLHPLLRLRRAVVAVLAANRFVRIAVQSQTLFISHACPGRAVKNMMVSSLLGADHSLPSAGKKQCSPGGRSHLSAGQRKAALQFIAWSSSERLHSVLSSSASQLLAAVASFQSDRATGRKSTTASRTDVALIARDCFSKLVQSLEGDFVSPTRSHDYDSAWSLVHRLGCGLQQAVLRLSRQSPRGYKLYLPVRHLNVNREF